MAPVIYLVRHAQGYHNLNKENEQLRDPDLTELGKQQCADLCKRFPFHDKITHLLASPMRRTIYTCLLSFAPVAEAGKVITALPDAQEVSLQPCDHGSDPAKLQAEFGDKVNFSLVPEGWNDKSPKSKYYPDPKLLAARARDARLWLRDLVREAGDDAQVVLVTHGGILHFLTGDWDGYSPTSGKFNLVTGAGVAAESTPLFPRSPKSRDIDLDMIGTGWSNTEFRSYEFADSKYEDPNASLRETKLSRRERRGSAIPLTETEQFQLQEAFSNIVRAELKEAKEAAESAVL
ncbi:hypothetical protein PG997_006414 [Apiospora hydei]|uniref:Phosphoglycerate mutase family protein n=1 Tax=Apiospora hydei TaxID=1337664 RepID=A0ABR1WRW2_9PEZI